MTGSDAFQTAVCWLRDAEKIVAFTGAGISAESGIPTFRDSAGLWEQFPPEQFAHWTGLLSLAAMRPGLLAEFLIALLEPIAQAQPNAAHRALARLERHKPVTIITQNIDGLHTEAGSSQVLEIHGCILRVVSADRSPVRTLSRSELAGVVEALRKVPEAFLGQWALWSAVRPLFGFESGGRYRPDIVLFGDAMAEPDWTLATQAARTCNLMVSIGTSGTVMPAASLPDLARTSRARVIQIDPEQPGGDLWLSGLAATIVPKLIDEAFSEP